MFVHLHVHTEHSMLDGLTRVGDLFDQAQADGAPAVAITDHKSLAAMWEAHKHASRTGVKLLPGLEAYIAIGSRTERQTIEVSADDSASEGGDAKATKNRKTRTYEHLTIIARDRTGWSNLVRLHNESSMHKHGRAQLIDYEVLQKYGEGLMVLTGCIGGPVFGPLSRAVAAEHKLNTLFGDRQTEAFNRASSYFSTPITIPDGSTEKQSEELRALALEAASATGTDGQRYSPQQIVDWTLATTAERGRARENVSKLIDAVGQENVYIEVMEHGNADEQMTLPELRLLAAEFSLPIVATNDSHHTTAEDQTAHSAWLALQTDSTLANSKFSFHGTGYHVRTSQEMRALSDEPWWQEACDNTLAVAARVEWDAMPERRVRLPEFPLPDGFERNTQYLRSLIEQGLEQRFPEGLTQEYKDRLNTELGTISGMGFIDYFLIVHEMITWAREQGFYVGPGRGSAAGSLVAYILGITQLDPIEYDLLFERFLEPGRAELPDIDIDFESRHKQQIIAHLVELWGEDHVAQIGNIGRPQIRQALKDALRVLGEPAALSDKLSKLLPQDLTATELLSSQGTGIVIRGEDHLSVAEFWSATSSVKHLEPVLSLMGSFYNVAKVGGVHASGVIISPEPLTELIPMRWHKPSSADWSRWVTEWDKDMIEDFGLVKFDILAIRNLDMAHLAIDSVNERTNESLEFYGLPDPDHDSSDPRVRKAFQMLQEGRTAGIFQLESDGMTRLLEEIGPDTLDDLSAVVALFRPGPLSAGMHSKYADRKNGREPVSYDYLTSDPEEAKWLGSVMDVTYGVFCVTEDTMVHSVDRGYSVPITSIRVGENVQGVNDLNENSTGRVSALMYNGVKKTIVTSFAGDRTLQSTADHQVLTPQGWVEIGSLRPGDVVASPWELLGDTGEGTAQERARGYVLGALLGDGGLTQRSKIELYSVDEDVLSAFETALREGFSLSTTRFVGTRGVMRSAVSSPRGGVREDGRAGTPENACLKWLRDCGLKSSNGGCGSHQKFIPDAILGAPVGVVRSVLAGLWDTDGMFSWSKNRSPVSTYRTVSRRLAHGVTHLLSRIGIASTVHVSRSNGCTSYTVTVIDVRELAEEISPLMGNTARVSVTRSFESAANRLKQRTSLLPNDLLIDTVRAHGLNARKCLSAKRTGHGRVRKLAEQTGSGHLSKLSNVRWVRITAQEDAGEKAVYDITVDEIHNFVANGMIIHNCYQEQVMRLGGVVAGFDDMWRSKLRKAVSKKIKSVMDEVGAKFLEGAVQEFRDETGAVYSPVFSEQTANRVWEAMKGSAEYLFNKSHSQAYAYIAYITAYLKANFPAHYGAATLSVTPPDKAEKRLAAMRALIDEGMQVLPPNINESGLLSAPNEAADSVLIGLSEIKGVGSAAEAIIESRTDAPYTSLPDLLKRTSAGSDQITLSHSRVEALIDSGALDAFGPRMGLRFVQRLGMNECAAIPRMEYTALELSVRQTSRLLMSLDTNVRQQVQETLTGWTRPGAENTGYASPSAVTVSELLAADVADGSLVHVAGILTSYEERPYKSGAFARVTLEDANGSLTGVLWEKERAAAKADGSFPRVGFPVVAFGKIGTRSFNVRSHGSDDEDGDGEEQEIVRQEITVRGVYPIDIPLTQVGGVDFSPHPKIDLTAPQPPEKPSGSKKKADTTAVLVEESARPQSDANPEPVAEFITSAAPSVDGSLALATATQVLIAGPAESAPVDEAPASTPHLRIAPPIAEPNDSTVTITEKASSPEPAQSVEVAKNRQSKDEIARKLIASMSGGMGR